MKYIESYNPYAEFVKNSKYKVGDYVILTGGDICKIMDIDLQRMGKNIIKVDIYRPDFQVWVSKGDIKRKAYKIEIEEIETILNAKKYNI